MARVPVLALLCAFAANAQVVITELHRDPSGGENESPGGASHEFIEITNFGAVPFDLDSLCLTDGVEADAVIPWRVPLPMHTDCIVGATQLLPGRIALILDSNYSAAAKKTPSSRFPIAAGTVLLTTDDADLGNGLANDDGIAIYKGTKTRVDAVICLAADGSWTAVTPTGGKITLVEPRDVPEGRSVTPVSFLFTAPRFETCADRLTPGSFEFLNNGWFAEWRFGTLDSANQRFACTLACIKAGAPPEQPLLWCIETRTPAKTAIAAHGDCIVHENRGDASCELPLDSAPHFLRLKEPAAQTVWPLDVSQIWTPVFSVTINEIFPRATANEPEWFELINVSRMPINLKNWFFGAGEDTVPLTRNDAVLDPGGFIVLTANAALFAARYPAKNKTTVPPRWRSLDNYNDTLRVWDAKRSLKETACYRSDWFFKWNDESIERVSDTLSGTDSSSWVLAASPTPGQPNGALFWRNASQPRLDIGPLPFTPNGDGRDDVLAISITLPAGYSAQIAVYGFSGKKLRTFPDRAVPSLYWDGKQDNGTPAPPGPFFVVMRTRSSSGSGVLRRKGVVWR